MSVAAIILAAGASRRLGRPKQLLTHAGETLIDRAIRLAAEAGAAPVITVLGANAVEITATIQPSRSIHVINDLWEQGIASSIHAGLHAVDSLAPSASAALLMTCDQPRLTAAHLRALLDRFEANGGSAILASAYADTVGIPAVFPRSTFAELHSLRGDRGARSLLAKPPCPLIAIDFEGGEVDIDTPADLAQLN